MKKHEKVEIPKYEEPTKEQEQEQVEPSPLQTTTEELIYMIGEREVKIAKLAQIISGMSQANKLMKEQLEGKDAGDTGTTNDKRGTSDKLDDNS